MEQQIRVQGGFYRKLLPASSQSVWFYFFKREVKIFMSTLISTVGCFGKLLHPAIKAPILHNNANHILSRSNIQEAAVFCKAYQKTVHCFTYAIQKVHHWSQYIFVPLETNSTILLLSVCRSTRVSEALYHGATVLYEPSYGALCVAPHNERESTRTPDRVQSHTSVYTVYIYCRDL